MIYKILFCSICLVFLSACGKEDLYNLVGKRKFQVGDCVAIGKDSEAESWDKADYRIVAYGNHAYLAQFIYKGKYTIDANAILYGYLFEGFYHKVDCPEEEK